MIPRRLIRSVPQDTTNEVERWWLDACELHDGWEAVTFRDPVDAASFPFTGPVWPRARSGAQLAGLIRLEALYHLGGVWLDSDVELYRPLDSLMDCRGFAAWEDENTVPDAVLGFEPEHPAVEACLALALTRIASDVDDWRTGNGAWATGPGVTTTVLPGRADVLLLPPGSFFAVHYSEKEKLAGHEPGPWEFGLHHWRGSWLS